MPRDGTKRISVGTPWGPVAEDVIKQHLALSQMQGFYSDLLVSAVAAMEEIYRIKGALGFDPNGPDSVPPGFVFIPGGMLVRIESVQDVRQDEADPGKFVLTMISGDERTINSTWEDIASMLRGRH